MEELELILRDDWKILIAGWLFIGFIISWWLRVCVIQIQNLDNFYTQCHPIFRLTFPMYYALYDGESDEYQLSKYTFLWGRSQTQDNIAQIITIIFWPTMLFSFIAFWILVMLCSFVCYLVRMGKKNNQSLGH